MVAILRLRVPVSSAGAAQPHTHSHLFGRSVVYPCRRHFAFTAFASNASNDGNAAPETIELPLNEEHQREETWEEFKRRRKTEWKRRQKGQNFLDNLILTVRGGKGGDGCVAFHREKFIPYGPPSGGNGGRGADIYIKPMPHMTSLASVSRRVVGGSGEHGKGTWQHGKNASPVVIHVPVGTIVRQLTAGDSRRAKDEWEAEEESLEGSDLETRREKKRERRWIHYPGAAEDNLQRDAFKQAEMQAYRLEKELRWERRQRRAAEPIMLDLDKIEDRAVDENAPLAQGRNDNLGHLLATGGAGGQGNPSFLTLANRSPKFATRGAEGERLTFALELKLLADVGLVGMPNAGKSTLLRALTGGRVKSEVASYAFTTLNPVVGVVRVAADGTFEGGLQDGLVIDETAVEKERALSAAKAGAYIPPRMRQTRKAIASDADNAEAQEYLEEEVEEDEDALIGMGYHFDSIETFRFTIADNPGLIAQSSENVGLGHSFLRSMERSLALVYVVDLSGPAPWDELRVLREELEAYQPGMSKRARLVIANKADLLASSNGEGDEEGGDVVSKEEQAKLVEQARAKLAYLQQYVREHMQTPLDDGTIRPLDVVATSAKYSQNLKKVVGLMQKYVEDARYAQEQEEGVNRIGSKPKVLEVEV